MTNFKKEDIKAIYNVINSSTHIGLITHQDPDGDTIGGAFALYYFLQKKGIKSTIFCSYDFPKYFQWMLNDKPKEEFFSYQDTFSFDTFILIDHSLYKRSEKTPFSIKEHPAKKIIIDHHATTPEDVAVAVVDSTAEATCKLIYQLIEDFNETHLVDRNIANYLYTGIITDTGNFAHGYKSISLFKVVVKLLEKGIDANYIYAKIYQNIQLNRLRFLGYVLHKKVSLLEQDKVALITLNKDELHRFHHETGDTEGFVNYPLLIKTVLISIFIIEKKDSIKLSFRSNDKKIPVNSYAKKYFNGGGHINAAGAFSKKSMKETVSFVKNTISIFLQSLK